MTENSAIAARIEDDTPRGRQPRPRQFTTGVLRAAGLDITHDNEPLGADGTVSWPLALRDGTAPSPGERRLPPYELPPFARAALSSSSSSSGGDGGGGAAILQYALAGCTSAGCARRPLPPPRARFAVVVLQTREPLASIGNRMRKW